MAAPTYNENLFKWELAHANVIDRKFSSPSTLKRTLESAGFHFSNSNTLEIHIEGMETACVKDKRRIAHLVKTKLWKPNPEELEMARPETCTPTLFGSK
jgi:hypothetical protein